MREFGFVPLALGIVQHLMSSFSLCHAFNYRQGHRHALLARLIRVPEQQLEVLISLVSDVKLNLLNRDVTV